MKKIFNLIFVLFLSFLIIGCSKTSKEITISFNTQGGSVITDIVIKETELDEFKLPSNPVRDGFKFMGWYIDDACTTPFKKVESDTVLYAKWEKEIEALVEYNLSNSFSVKEVVDGVLCSSGSYDVLCRLQYLNEHDIKLFNDTHALISFIIDYTSASNIENVERVEYVASIKDGYLYLTIPNILLDPTNASKEFTNVCFDINKVFEKIGEFSTSFNEENFNDLLLSLLPLDDQILLKELNDVLIPILDKYGLRDQAFIDEFKEVITSLTLNSTDASVEITDAEFKAYLLRVSDHLIKISDKIVPAAFEIFKVFTKVYKINTGEIFIKGQDGWIDNLGNLHSFVEDVDGLYGVVIDDYYYCYVLDEVFKLEVDSATFIERAVYGDYYSYYDAHKIEYIGLLDSFELIISDEGVISKTTIDTIYNDTNFGFILDNIFKFNHNIRFSIDITNNKVIDQEEEDILDTINSFEELKTSLQSDFEKFNIEKFIISTTDNSYDLTFEYKQEDIEVTHVFINYHIEFNVLFENIDLILLDYGNYLDVTNMILDKIS